MSLLHAFGPGDIHCVAVVPGKAYVLEEVTDFSISTHFDKIPIRRLGHRLPVGWATGSGSVAGTLVCAQFTHGALWKLRQHSAATRLLRDQVPSWGQAPTGPGLDGMIDNLAHRIQASRLEFFTAGILPQQLPPFHLLFVHQNNAGQMGIARLYGVVISDHGEVKGAHNAFTEETLQFQALYYEQIRLHKSLTLEQMADLAGRSGAKAMFTEYRRPQTSDITQPYGTPLVDELIDITGGPVNSLQYLIGETEMMQRRLADDTFVDMATTIALADQGDIVWAESINEDGSPTGEVAEIIEAVKPQSPDFDPGRSFEMDINDYFLVVKSNTSGTRTLQAVRVRATLAVRKKMAYLLPRTETVTDEDLIGAAPLGQIEHYKDDLRIAVNDTTYVSALRNADEGFVEDIAELSLGSADDFGNITYVLAWGGVQLRLPKAAVLDNQSTVIFFEASRAQLLVNENAGTVYRERLFDEAIALEALAWPFALEALNGTYASQGEIDERYVFSFDKETSSLQVDAAIGSHEDGVWYTTESSVTVEPQANPNDILTVPVTLSNNNDSVDYNTKISITLQLMYADGLVRLVRPPVAGSDVTSTLKANSWVLGSTLEVPATTYQGPVTLTFTRDDQVTTAGTVVLTHKDRVLATKALAFTKVDGKLRLAKPVHLIPGVILTQETTIDANHMLTPVVERNLNFSASITQDRPAPAATVRYFHGDYRGDPVIITAEGGGANILAESSFLAGIKLDENFRIGQKQELFSSDSGLFMTVDLDAKTVRLEYSSEDIAAST